MKDHFHRTSRCKRVPQMALMALAVLACSTGAAQAQSNVKISGYLDIAVYQGFNKIRNVGTVARNNIAFSGSEDLGGGLSATFKLSHRFELDDGTVEGAGKKPFFHGESTVGLKGAFGSIRLGRALDVISNNDWAFDPWGNFDRIASPAWNNWHWNYASSRTSNAGSAEFGRLNNGIFYDSPSLGGFKVNVSGSFENTDTTVGAGTGNNLGVSLHYGSGPLTLMVANSKNANSDTVQFVGAKYSFGALTLMGALDKSTYKAAVDSVAKVYTLGASYNLGATTLMAGYGHRDVSGAGNQFIGLGASYALSKRTNLYASYGNSKPEVGVTKSAYGAGINHSF